MSVFQEFEIELEGSQTLRLLCYEKCCTKTKQSKDDAEMTDKIMAKGQIKVQRQIQNTSETQSNLNQGGRKQRVCKIIFYSIAPAV